MPRKQIVKSLKFIAMKLIVIMLFCLNLSFMVFGQIEEKAVKVNLEEVEITPAKFTGIENVAAVMHASNPKLIRDYVAVNVVYPESALESDVEGTEVVEFVITPEGKITNFNVVNSISQEIDSEIIRVLKTTNGMWKPGYRNGVPVECEQELSMAFCVNHGDFDSVKEYFFNRACVSFQNANKQFFVKGNSKKALRKYNQGIRYLPNDKALLFLRGLCLYELGDEEGARKDWNKIVSQGGMVPNMTAYDLTKMKGYGEMAKMIANK